MIKSHVPCVEAGHANRSRSYLRKADAVPQNIAGNPHICLVTAFDRAKSFLVFEALMYGCTPQARGLLNEAAQLSAGFFQCIQSDGESIRIRYRDGELETVGVYTTDRATISDWFDAFWLAMITRDKQSLSILLEQDPKVFTEGVTGPPTAFAAMLRGVLMAYAQGSDEVVSLCTEARKFYDPEGYSQARVLRETLIWFPILDLFEVIFREEGQEAFNQTMHTALLKHREYGEHEYTSWEDYVSFPLTAMAVIAYDQAGYEVTVENEYILDWAVKPE